jgi:hypothetical protein
MPDDPEQALAILAEAISPGVSDRQFLLAIMAEREKQTERIFAERESSAEFKRIALKEAVDEGKVTTQTALLEARATTEQKLVDAKTAADEREKVIQNRLDKLESGGAPFANRLDEGVTKLREDVDTLNTDAVRTKVLDALRVQQAEEAKQQKRQVRLALLTAGIAAAIAIAQALGGRLGH